MTKLEEEIKQIIDETTDREYVSKLRVVKEDDTYILYLYLNRELVPMTMGCQGDEETFKKFVRKEMKTRRLQEVRYWKTDRTLPATDCNGQLTW